ncbi:MAG: hypothetical protein JRN15_24000, partial [Nitrososphaerota archaeon]|nr:hypothetical protein [Nitrososphaerota archaeon]
GRNPGWRDLGEQENKENKRRLDGCVRKFPNGKRRLFRYGKKAVDWQYTRSSPCKTCYGWDPWFSSECAHEKYVCPDCGRKQCLLHWPYPMQTEVEAIHFLKSAELRTGKKCFFRHVKIGKFEKWKIFVSELDYESYVTTRKHKR